MPAFTTESYTQFINEEEDDDPPLPRPSRLDNWRQRLPSFNLPSLPQLRPTLLILVSFAFLCLVLVIASVFYLPQLQTADTDQTEVAETVALITKEVAPTPLVAQLFDEQPPDEIIFVAPDPMTFITYEVQYGDSLDSIADQYYGTTGAWEMIFQANRDILPDSSILEPGMILRIPAEQWEASEPPEPQFERSYPTAFVNHEVQVGDSLDDLALQFYGEQSAWLTIFQANRDLLPDATVLEPGMNLRIPMVNHIAAH
jgi:nucleoid-associated protein YgaU